MAALRTEASQVPGKQTLEKLPCRMPAPSALKHTEKLILTQKDICISAGLFQKPYILCKDELVTMAPRKKAKEKQKQKGRFSSFGRFKMVGSVRYSSH